MSKPKGTKNLHHIDGVGKAMVGFRYHQSKYEFLVKEYGSRLPEELRKCADQLIVNAIKNKL